MNNLQPARPRLEARRHAFMEAATKVFLAKGYAGATLDEVIACSGGSRQTLYALFGGKRGLFEALVRERSASIFRSFATEEFNDLPPAEVLPRMVARYLAIVTTPEALGMYRIVVSESASRHEIGDLFWRAGPGNARRLLAHYLAVQAERRILAIADAEQAAGLLIGMLLNTLHTECLLGTRGTPSPDEIEAIAGRVAALFLNACRA